MNNWPSWIPLPRSWFNALALLLLLFGIQQLSVAIWPILLPIINLPKIGILIYVALFILAPIALVAAVHHWSHQVLDQFFPDSRLPQPLPATGAMPGLLSWWEGLYGWVVSYFVGIIWAVCVAIALPLPATGQLSPTLLVFANPAISTWYLIEFGVKAIAAAYLYQFEFAVKRSLLTAHSTHS